MRLLKKIAPDFVDARGQITRLLDDGQTVIRSALLISSRRGSVRASHYHKTDSHHVYLVSGRMEYLEYPVQAAPATAEKVIVEAGDLLYTPPMVVHVMRFLEDSVFLALATNSRHQAAYEEDTVRVQAADHGQP